MSDGIEDERELEDRTAGRGLDALIAERVMGFVWRRVRSRDGSFRALYPTAMADDLRGDETAIDNTMYVPRYSTDIAAAWQIGDRCRETRCYFFVDLDADGNWHARVGAADEATAPTAPLAICRAAINYVRSTSHA